VVQIKFSESLILTTVFFMKTFGKLKIPKRLNMKVWVQGENLSIFFSLIL